MLSKIRDNWIIVIMSHHDNTMTSIYLLMLIQIQRILGSPKMIPFTTIFESVRYCFEKSRVSKEKAKILYCKTRIMYRFYLKMRMLLKLRDNRIIAIMSYHDNTMTAIHIQMLKQMRRILESPKMRPFATILIVFISAWETGTSVYQETDIIKMPFYQNFS